MYTDSTFCKSFQATAGFEDGRGYEPRNAGGLQNMDKSSISGISGWMQIQTTKGFLHPIFKMPSVKSLQTRNAEGVLENSVPPSSGGI